MVRIKKSSDYADLVERVFQAKEVAAQASELHRLAEAELVEYMQTNQKKTLTVGQHRATYVSSSTFTVDETRLKKALGATSYNKLTTAKFDRKKLEAAMESGDVDPHVVSPCVTEKKSRPFLRTSVVANDA